MAKSTQTGAIIALGSKLRGREIKIKKIGESIPLKQPIRLEEHGRNGFLAADN